MTFMSLLTEWSVFESNSHMAYVSLNDVRLEGPESPYDRKHLVELIMTTSPYDRHLWCIRKKQAVAPDKSQFQIVILNPADQGQVHLGSILRLNYI